MPTSKKTTKAPLFEENLDQLTQIVESLEKGSLTIEDALSQFEKGVTLVKTCQSALQAAEQKIQMLSTATPKDED